MTFNWMEVKPHHLNFCPQNYGKRFSKNVLYMKFGKLTNKIDFPIFGGKQSIFDLFTVRGAQL